MEGAELQVFSSNQENEEQKRDSPVNQPIRNHRMVFWNKKLIIAILLFVGLIMLGLGISIPLLTGNNEPAPEPKPEPAPEPKLESDTCTAFLSGESLFKISANVTAYEGDIVNLNCSLFFPLPDAEMNWKKSNVSYTVAINMPEYYWTAGPPGYQLDGKAFVSDVYNHHELCSYGSIEYEEFRTSWTFPIDQEGPTTCRVSQLNATWEGEVFIGLHQ